MTNAPLLAQTARKKMGHPIFLFLFSLVNLSHFFGRDSGGTKPAER